MNRFKILELSRAVSWSQKLPSWLKVFIKFNFFIGAMYKMHSLHKGKRCFVLNLAPSSFEAVKRTRLLGGEGIPANTSWFYLFYY